MDGSSDFSFYKGNSLANDGELGSPKAWPQLSSLNISEKSENSNVEQPDKPVHDENVSQESSEVKIKEVKSAVDSSTFKQPVATAQPMQRTKVPFEKGFSQMAWMKLTRTHPDLAGLKGSSNRRIISMDEVKKHKSEGDSWTVLRGRVYNISPYLKFHPGGVDMLMKAAGKDCTALFNKYHAWVNAEFLLEKCLVGILEVPN